VVAADENGDGRLNIGEVGRLILRADSDGDGLVSFGDIDKVIASRSRSFAPPAASLPPRGAIAQTTSDPSLRPAELVQGPGTTGRLRESAVVDPRTGRNNPEE
jgi:hypothetical protein